MAVKGVSEKTEFQQAMVNNEPVNLPSSMTVEDIRSLLGESGLLENANSAVAEMVDTETVRFVHEHSVNG